MLWLVLAALLIVAAVKGRMPVWAVARSRSILLPLSCARRMDGRRRRRPGGRPSAIWVPALVPPLFALDGSWARLPALHTRLHARRVTSAVLGAAIVLLTAAAAALPRTRAALPILARPA